MGCDTSETIEFVFGAQRVEDLVFGDDHLPPTDPRLEWFTFRGDARRNGPFPPSFLFSPYDGLALESRREEPGFGFPFDTDRGFPEVTDGSRRLPLPAAMPTRGQARTLYFAKAHHGFFACGRHPRLHAVSEEGHVEWFASADLFDGEGGKAIAGHSYGDLLGRLLPRHRHAVAVGRLGFATVARDEPVWVRATPFTGASQARDRCPGARALGAPIFVARPGQSPVPGSFHWPVVVDGRTRIASREDRAGASWTFTDCDGDASGVELAPPHRRDGDGLVWVATSGYLLVDNGCPRWHVWSDGFSALPHAPPHLDVNGNLWQFGKDAQGFAFAKLGSGPQHHVPVTGYHVSGGRFTVQGSDFFTDPTFQNRNGELPGIDGALVVPVLAWSDGAVVALVTLPPGVSPDDYYLTGGSTVATSTFRLLSFADLGLRNLDAGVMISGHQRDLAAFVFGGSLFLTSSRETRCVVWPLA